MSAAERWFDAYGIGVRLRADDELASGRLAPATLAAHLPPGWRSGAAQSNGTSIEYRVSTETAVDGAPIYRLHSGDECLLESPDGDGLLRVFASHAELAVAERSPTHLFVHAGVVCWHGHAIVIPGHSHAGKTTLVREFLRAGATYYSDEYAVLDPDGRVHPYARPLSVRVEPGGMSWRETAADLGAPVGAAPLPVGIILVTRYRPGGVWRPRRLTPGHALLALMRHTVAARGNPAHSMPILKRVAEGAAAMAGPRGEASLLVTRVSGGQFSVNVTVTDITTSTASPFSIVGE